jgi:hypothetical protein
MYVIGISGLSQNHFLCQTFVANGYLSLDILSWLRVLAGVEIHVGHKVIYCTSALEIAMSQNPIWLTANYFHRLVNDCLHPQCAKRARWESMSPSNAATPR